MANEYFITDGRPLPAAYVCEVCKTLNEARRNRTDYGDSAQIYKVHIRGKVLPDESEWKLQRNEAPAQGEPGEGEG